MIEESTFAVMLPLFNIICWSYVLITLGGLL